MICAGGTDCGANVWILEMWPGQDSWLQALHFSFAVGCALGPLLVEPFLSVEYKENEIDKIAGKTSGTTTINDQNNETRIHIPYAISGLASIGAAVFIIYLYWLEQKRKVKAAKLKLKQQAAAGEQILLTAVQHPAMIEAGNSCNRLSIDLEQQQQQQPVSCVENETQQAEQLQEVQVVTGRSTPVLTKNVDNNALTESAVFLPKQQQQQDASDNQQTAAQQLSPSPTNLSSNLQQTNLNQQQQQQLTQSSVAVTSSSTSPQLSPQQQPLLQQESITIQQNQLPPNQQQQQLSLVVTPSAQTPTPTPTPTQTQNQNQNVVKITSKAKEQLAGRPPYYVMFAIALAALCLSFYCGIEITSMNYLATFAVNIDLQLSKTTAALMSSALTISFAVGRGFGIWIAAYMKPHKLFYLCAGVMATGNVFMLIFANTAERFLWWSICIFGIGCGPMFPAIVSFYDDKISKVTNTVSGIFILGSMFNVALNTLIIGHHIIDNALILIVCNLIGSIVLLLLFGTLHMLTKVKKHQRVKKFRLKQQGIVSSVSTDSNLKQQPEQQITLLNQQQQSQQ